MAKGTRATAALDKAGVAHRLHAYAYTADVDSKGLAAAIALGIEPAQMYKTLMAWADKQAMIVVIPSDQRLSLKKLAVAAGAKQAQMMEIVEAERRSGYKVGGISPFAQQRPASVLFAESVLQHPRIYLNAGQRGLLLDIAPADALRVLQARCAAITES